MVFRLHPNGFANKDRRALTAELRGLDKGDVSAGQMSYDPPRLKTRDLITRIEGTHRYRVTDHGLDTANFLTCVQDRVLRTGLAELATDTTTPSRLKSAANTYRSAVDMRRFPTAGHLASWAGLCQGRNESAGKRKSGKTRAGNTWLAGALGNVAPAAGRTKDTYLAARYRRLKPRLGAKKTIVAIEHKIITAA